jgi:CheY-like chemotaxis protein
MAHEVSEKLLLDPPAAERFKATVLVVDDDPHFRMLARTILEPAGFDVIESEDVPQCLAQVRRQAWT